MPCRFPQPIGLNAGGHVRLLAHHNRRWLLIADFPLGAVAAPGAAPT
jgi:hypothetical protein